jgi:membrane-bound lytic murein transglycosylase MltF
MQVLPQYAASPIDIPDVHNAQDSIHAGAKMLAQITKTYFISTPVPGNYEGNIVTADSNGDGKMDVAMT